MTPRKRKSRAKLSPGDPGFRPQGKKFLEELPYYGLTPELLQEWIPRLATKEPRVVLELRLAGKSLQFCAEAIGWGRGKAHSIQGMALRRIRDAINGNPHPFLMKENAMSNDYVPVNDIAQTNDIADAAYNAGVLEGTTAPQIVYVLKIDENNVGYEVELFAHLEDAEAQLARRRYNTLDDRRHWEGTGYAACLAAGDIGDWEAVNNLWDFDDAFDFWTHIVKERVQ